MEKADMPPRDYRIFGALVYRVDWHTGVIPEPWQPRSLTALAKASRMSRAVAAEGLNHLERHGWVHRVRQEPGRGRATRYELRPGADCDCAKASRADGPRTDAERMRAYRARKKASGICVTESLEASGICVTSSPGERNSAAGQEHLPAKRATRGKVEGEFPKREYAGGPVDFYTGEPVAKASGWPAGSFGAEANGEQ